MKVEEDLPKQDEVQIEQKNEPQNTEKVNQEVQDEKKEISPTELNNKEKILIENYIKKKANVISPTIYLEYQNEKDSSPLIKFDVENLKTYLSKFGKINFIEVYRLKISLIQFDSFFSAYSCIKYFEKVNLKDKEKIICRWFEEKDEEIIVDDIINKIKKLKPYEIVENINKSMKDYYKRKKERDYNTFENQEDDESSIKENILTDGVSQMECYSLFSLTLDAQKEFNDIVNMNKDRGIQNIESTNIPNKENNIIQSSEKSNTNIKYICKFYLQIEADKEFQIVKRVIGAKGCNLKRIIDYCSKGPGGVYMEDSIKLKLRGIGSGYKEKEGEKKEPLYLCVISKYQDKYKKACSFVVELIINIFGEYKRFCDRKGKKPVSNLNIQKLEYISTRGN